jgi:hypothetical protein
MKRLEARLSLSQALTTKSAIKNIETVFLMVLKLNL